MFVLGCMALLGETGIDHTDLHFLFCTFAVVQAVMDTCRPTLFSIQSILILFKVKYLQARATC